MFFVKCCCKFFTFLSISSFLLLKTLKMHIQTSVLGVQHPNAGQNMQHSSGNLFKFWLEILSRLSVNSYLTKCIVVINIGMIFGMAAMPFLCTGTLLFQGNLTRVLPVIIYKYASCSNPYTVSFLILSMNMVQLSV